MRGGWGDVLMMCHGIGFRPCGAPSSQILTEVWSDGRWGASGLCWEHYLEHTRRVRSEYNGPPLRIYQEVTDYVTRGLPEQTKDHDR